MWIISWEIRVRAWPLEVWRKPGRSWRCHRLRKWWSNRLGQGWSHGYRRCLLGWYDGCECKHGGRARSACYRLLRDASGRVAQTSQKPPVPRQGWPGGFSQALRLIPEGSLGVGRHWLIIPLRWRGRRTRRWLGHCWTCCQWPPGSSWWGHVSVGQQVLFIMSLCTSFWCCLR